MRIGAFAVPQPTVTHTTPAPQNHTVNAGNVSWSFHVPQPSVRHTTPFVIPAGISYPKIFTSRPTNVYTAGLGAEITGNVYGVTIDEGKDSVRSQNPARPRSLSCQLTAPVGIYGSDTYQEGDLVECQVQDADGQETWFKGILDKPRETSLQGDRTHVNLRAFGLTVLLSDARPVTPSLRKHHSGDGHRPPLRRLRLANGLSRGRFDGIVCSSSLLVVRWAGFRHPAAESPFGLSRPPFPVV